MKGAPTTSPAISSGILTIASEIHNYNTRVNLNIHRQSILGFHMTSSKLKKQGIINPFEILVSLVIRTSEDLSFCKFSV